ncbi:MAG: TFIIB-type zinc ribbon-containing protein [Nitrososphaerota archaeon]
MEKEKFLGKRCPQCGSKYLIEDSRTGEISCQSCGYVLSEIAIDQGPEWREFEESEKSRSRVGPPQSIMYEHLGLSTTISKDLKDAQGKALPKETRKHLSELRKADYRSQINIAQKRNLEQAANVLRIYADKLNLPDYVIEGAMQIYKEALKKDLIRGRAIRNIIAAATYAACRISGTPRDLREFEKAYPIVTKKDIARDYRLLMKYLNLKVQLTDPTIYVNKIASKLGLGQNIIQETMKILNKAEEIGATIGKDPVGIAAAALYLACRENNIDIMQKDVAKASGVTLVTIRNRSKDLEDYMKSIPKEKEVKEEVTSVAES